MNEDDPMNEIARVVAEVRAELLKDRDEAHRRAQEVAAKFAKIVRLTSVGVVVGIAGAAMEVLFYVFGGHHFLDIINGCSLLTIGGSTFINRHACVALRDHWAGLARQFLIQRQMVLDRFPRVDQ